MKNEYETHNLNYYKTESNRNLESLAYELLINHLDASTIDLPSELDDKEEILKAITQKTIIDSKEAVKRGDKDRVRNVLVIGAGCSFNTFENFPLGNTARALIEREIIVHDSNKARVTFEDFKNYVLNIPLKEYESEDKEFSLKQINARAWLEDYFAREKEENRKTQQYNFLVEISKRYQTELERLKLYSKDYGKKSDLDFETSLNLLSKFVPVTSIRETIQKFFNFRHGPITFYQLVAHLFKNRYIDVIINFNFDEFLDQALDEELGQNGYDAIISDGDCRPISELTHAERLRQPLYIKPHGTASHKSTMRFTKDQYYELPEDMHTFLTNVLSVRLDSGKVLDKRLNLITVGFEMNSIEFEEILKLSFNSRSKIFSFYFHKTGRSDEETQCIYNFNTNKRTKEKDFFPAIIRRDDLIRKFINKNQPTSGLKVEHIFPIGHEFYQNYSSTEDDTFDCTLTDRQPSLANTFTLLTEMVYSLFEDKFKPQTIYRHKLIAELFGNRDFYKKTNEYIEETRKKFHQEPKIKPDQFRKFYPEEYFNSEDYFKDRVIIEILISLATNSGKVYAPELISGTVGKFYSEYLRCINLKRKNFKDERELEYNGELTRNVKDRIRKQAENKYKIIEFKDLLWFCVASNPKEPNELKIFTPDTTTDRISDYLGLIKKDVITEKDLKDLKAEILREIEDGVSLFSPAFQRHLESYDVELFYKQIIKPFYSIIRSNNSRILSELRNTQYHIFEAYESTNLLNTDLAIDLNYQINLRPGNNRLRVVKIISESVDRVSKFIDEIVAIDAKISIILADTLNHINLDLINEVYNDPKKPETGYSTDEVIAIINQVYQKGNISAKGDLDIIFDLKRRIIKKKILKAFKRFKDVEDDGILNWIDNNVEIHFLPMQLHNHHMTIFERQSSDNERVIYFYRRGMNPQINPVRLIKPANIKLLKTKFDDTLKQSKEYSSNELVFNYFTRPKDLTVLNS